MAAVLAKGTTVIDKRRARAGIGDVAIASTRWAQVTGIGRLVSLSKGSPGSWHAPRGFTRPHRTGTYAMAVAMTGGDVLLQNTPARTAAVGARRAGQTAPR